MARSLRNEDIFQAIAHPMRRRVLEILKTGAQPASALAETFDVSFPAMSQQLNVLKNVGLISEQRVGRQRIYQLHPKPLKEVLDWVEFFEEFWIKKLDALGEHLRKKHGKPQS
jgi:DNA-binding transcriptional ArsR family regulator